MYYPFSENKGADQLRGYREADLDRCLCICKCWFSHDAAHIFFLSGTEVEPVPMEHLDQLLMEVDENQKTIMSVGAQSTASIDTQDSAIFETSPLQCGNINFIRDVYQGMGYQVIWALRHK